MPSPTPRSGEYRSVLLAYDDSPRAQEALTRVVAIVSPDTLVTVITVVALESGCPRSAPVSPERLDWQWRTLTAATTYLREHGIRPFIEAAVGNPALAILETAQALDVDLVVLGGGDSQKWRQLLHGIDCDVLLAVSTIDVGSQDEP